MEENQSKLVKRITEIDLTNRFFKPILVRGKEYFDRNKVKYLYSPRYEEVVGVVSGTNDYYVHISFDKNIIHYDCTCPYQYNCKHIVAVLYAIRSNPKEIGVDASIMESVRGNNSPSTYDLITFLKRLIGKQYVINGYVEGEFNIYFSRLIKMLKETLNNDEDKYLTGKYITECLTIASLAKYHDSTYTIKMERDIYPLMNSVYLSNMEIENNLLEGILNNINENNINLLIESLKEFNKTYTSTPIYERIVNGVFTYASMNQNIDINSLIILKAKSLYQTDKESFIKYANTYSYVEEIRTLLFQAYNDDNNYDNIISLYEKYDIDFNLKNYGLYLNALIKKGYEYLDSVVQVFENNPSYELYEKFKDLNIIDDELKEKINNIVSSQNDFPGKTKIVSEIGNVQDIYKVIISNTNVRERIEAVHDNIDFLIGINDEELIKIIQDDICSIVDRAESLKAVTKYLDDLFKFELGNMYVIGLLIHIYNRFRLYYKFDYQTYNSYMKKAKEI